jgi:hypothetical protein
LLRKLERHGTALEINQNILSEMGVCPQKLPSLKEAQILRAKYGPKRDQNLYNHIFSFLGTCTKYGRLNKLFKILNNVLLYIYREMLEHLPVFSWNGIDVIKKLHLCPFGWHKCNFLIKKNYIYVIPGEHKEML